MWINAASTPHLPPLQTWGKGEFPKKPPLEWLNLLHSRPTLFGYESEITDPNFFITKGRGSHPLRELKGELEILERGGEKAVRLRCRFPLRYLWLIQHFPYLSKIPISACPKLQKALKAISPYKVSIVFADAYINKPAYMFGHTLLRIDDNRTNPLISTAVNYAARVNPNDGGLAFAFKGIFGFYRGYYTPMPYYDKIKQYIEQEGRDLWEYSLDFTPQQTYWIALHTWELRNIYSPYYFFSRNCSYELLWLIEVARPDLGVIDHFRGKSVIPIDTIRYLYQKGVITGVHYRPSTYIQIKTISAPLPPRLKKLVKEIGTGQKSPKVVMELNLTPSQQGRILDSAVRYLQYRASREGWSRKRYIDRFLKILRVRSKVPFIANYHYHPPVRPDLGHFSHRWEVGYGVEGRRPYYLIGLRGAYQSLEDPVEGFKKGSQVIFFEPKVRWMPDRKKWYLDQIGLIDLKSIVPRSILFSPISWKVRFGIYRDKIASHAYHPLWTLNPGGGFAYQVDNGYLYGLLETQFQYSQQLNRNYRIGGGVEVGYLLWFKKIQFYLKGERLNYIGQYKNHSWDFSISTTYKLGRNDVIIGKVGRGYLYDWESRASLSFCHYFNW